MRLWEVWDPVVQLHGSWLTYVRLHTTTNTVSHLTFVFHYIGDMIAGDKGMGQYEAHGHRSAAVCVH